MKIPWPSWLHWGLTILQMTLQRTLSKVRGMLAPMMHLSACLSAGCITA